MYIYQKINFSRFSFWLLIIDWNMLKEIVIRDLSERQKGRYFSKCLGSIPYWGATLVPMRNLSILYDYFLQFYYWKIAVNATQKYCWMVSNYWELMLNHWNRVQSVAPWLSFQSEVLCQCGKFSNAYWNIALNTCDPVSFSNRKYSLPMW